MPAPSLHPLLLWLLARVATLPAAAYAPRPQQIPCDVLWPETLKRDVAERAVRHYYVRATVSEVIGAQRDGPPANAPHLEYTPATTAIISIVVAMLLLAFIAARRFRRMRLMAFFDLLSAGFLLAALLLWWHSYRSVDELAFATKLESCHLTSANGWLAILTVDDIPQPRAVGVRWDPSADRPIPWYTRYLVSTTPASWGLHFEAGKTAGGSAEPTYPYSLQAVHWGYFAAAFAFFPSSSAYGAIKRALKRKWRRRQGRCLACGNDMCGIPAGALCPECGTEPAGK